MPRNSSLTQLSRRELLKAGLVASTGLIASDHWLAPSQAATWHVSDKWFRVLKVDRTTVRLPFRETPARNMDREIPHWRWTEVIEIELTSGVTGFGETLLYYTWGVPDDEDIRRVLGKNAIEVMWDDELGAGLQMALFDAVARTVVEESRRVELTATATLALDEGEKIIRGDRGEAVRGEVRAGELVEARATHLGLDRPKEQVPLVVGDLAERVVGVDPFEGHPQPRELGAALRAKARDGVV